MMLAGLATALVAAAAYGVAVTVQARQARQVAVRHSLRLSLLRRLACRPLWVAGAATGVLAWCLQAAAISLAPLTLVAPTLALSLVFILLFGGWDGLLHRREFLGVTAVTAGIAAIGVVAPSRHTIHAGGSAIAVAAALAMVASWPQALRSLRPPAWLVATSAGAAYGLVTVATKMAVDAVDTQEWSRALAWLAVAAAAGLVGLLGEMSALQKQPAWLVAPIVFALNVAVPTIAAPLVAGERWSRSTDSETVLVLALMTVTAGVVALARSNRVLSVWDAVEDGCQT
jgi:hypothetical protein